MPKLVNASSILAFDTNLAQGAAERSLVMAASRGGMAPLSVLINNTREDVAQLAKETLKEHLRRGERWSSGGDTATNSLDGD